MRLLRTHILRSLASPFVFAWVAMTAMLMLNQLSRRFSELVGKGLPAGVITEVLLLFIPFIVALTLPMAILVAVLYAFGQMGSDNELTAMRANGVSVLQMLRPVFVAGVVLSATNFLFIDQVLPRTNLRLLNLQSDIAQKKPTFSLFEQAMNTLPGSQYFLRASRIEPVTGRMREIIIYDMSPADARRVIYADSGYMAFERDGQDLGIRLYDGEVHEYKTAEPTTLNVTGFDVNNIVVRNIQNAFRQSVGSVERGDREMTTCEMMDRVQAARRNVRDAAARRRLLAENDVRALLNLLAVAPARSGAARPPASCLPAWRSLERRLGRLLLPAPAPAQAPPPPAAASSDTTMAPQARTLAPPPAPPPSPVVVPPAPPAPPAAAVVDSVPPAPDTIHGPLLASFSGPGEVTTVREEEFFARREVNQYAVEIHKKFALSVACMNFVLIGIALALRFPRGGVGLVIGGSLVIFALFYVGLTAGENLADKGMIPPSFIWLPNLIVFLAGVVGLLRVNREFGSTRGGDLADLADWLFGWIRRRRRAA